MRIGILLVAALVMACGPELALADPVEIDFAQPVYKKEKGNGPALVSTQAFSGWPLTIEMTMVGELGIASQNGGVPPYFPDKGDTAFVLFADPDGCLIFDWLADGPSNWDVPAGDSCYDDDNSLQITQSDETYFEFTPDLDDVGVKDFSGNHARRAGLVEAMSGRPMIDPVGGEGPEGIGPATGVILNAGTPEEEEILDGYGYGADDDVPGLVLIARHGPGIVYEANGIASSPLELRNLAGFTNSVGYELNNVKSKTTVSAHMLVPSFLFAPVVIADESFAVANTEIQPGWRVDGAAITGLASDIVGEPVGDTFHEGYSLLVGKTRYQISAMVVSGVAPNTVVDMNGDDEIDEWDLELMGYTVLGDKKSFEFDVFPPLACFGGGDTNTVYADLDGNGASTLGQVCPAGPGSVSEPPR